MLDGLSQGSTGVSVLRNTQSARGMLSHGVLRQAELSSAAALLISKGCAVLDKTLRTDECEA